MTVCDDKTFDDRLTQIERYLDDDRCSPLPPAYIPTALPTTAPPTTAPPTAGPAPTTAVGTVETSDNETMSEHEAAEFVT